MNKTFKAAVAAHSPGRWPCRRARGGPSVRDDDGYDAINLVGFSVLERPTRASSRPSKTTDAGKGVTFKESYGASGDQSRAVDGRPEGRLRPLLARARRHPPGRRQAWSPTTGTRPTKGIVTHSVVVIVVRKGNPKNIKAWDDLIKPGVEIVTPNPASSGSAQWNILAAYGHVLADGGTEADAKAYLTKFFEQRRRPARAAAATPPPRSSAAPATCCSPTRTRRSWPAQSGADFDYVVPGHHLLIENPGAVTDGRRPDRRKDFLDFVAQRRRPEASSPRRASARSTTSASTVEVEGANDPTNPFPDAGEAADHRRGLRRLGRGRTRSSSTRTTASITKIQPADRQVVSDRRCTSIAAAEPRGPTGAARRRSGRARALTPASGARARRGDDLVQPAGPDPAGRGRRQAAGGRLGGFCRHAHQPADPRGAQADRRSGARSSPLVNVVMGTLIAWVLVRDRFWGKRVLDVVIDIPFALPTIVAGLVLLVALRPAQPARRQRRQHPQRGVPRARVRDAAVRRAHGAAGARGARAPTSRRPRPRSAPAGSRPSAGSSCPAWSPAIAAGAALSFARGDQRVRLAGAAVAATCPTDRGRLGARPHLHRERRPAAAAAAVATMLLVVALARDRRCST